VYCFRPGWAKRGDAGFDVRPPGRGQFFVFESNFPVDKGSCGYAALWNAFKRIAAGYSADEKAALFAGSAAKFYRLE
jgi:predicted TIM-barrel fold metal-dependent hydrolase